MGEGRLRKEIGKRGAFDSSEEELLLNLLRTHDQLQIRFVRLFREHGLTPAQYNILRILRGEGRPLPCLEIASRLLTIVPGITGLIDRLEALGLVMRLRGDADRRVIYVAITEAGQERLAGVDEPLRRLHRELVGHLEPGEQRELIRLLEKARAGRDAGAADHDE
ncbi:MAG: MarR family transcriptional regulator [Isosphaeraceae bacterium]|nr:MarR family transcriptional regulator [Isosphaeraceae bacterium]